MTRKLTVLLLSIASLVFFTSAMLSNGGKAGKTGSPGESDCSGCHGDFTVNTGGSISISGLPANNTYTPGSLYNVSITIVHTGYPLFGFGCEVLTSANANAGTLAITNAVETRLASATVSGVSRQSVTQQAGGGQTNDQHTFNFNWTAPAAGTGNVTFYYSSVAADNGGDETNDYVYTGSLALTEAAGCTTPAQPGAITGSTAVCAGSSQTYSVSAVAGATDYRWTLPSGWTGTSTTNSITVTAGSAGGNLSVEAHNACGYSTPRTQALTVNAAVTPTLSIASGAGTTICSGTSVTFTATPTNGGTTPSYQWKLNGTNVGTNSTSYTNAVLANNDQVSCVMTSNAACVSPTTATSNTISMTVNAAVTPALSIASGSGTTICSGTSVTFTATPTNGGTTPSYQWKLNGSIVGTNSTTYTTSALANGNQVSCVMTSNAACVSPVTATSNTITMTVNAAVTPSLSIASGAGTTICSGTSVTFTATPTNGGTTPSYQWKLNGSNVGTNTATYTNAALANNDQVSCVMTSNASCASPATATSNTVTMTVNGSVAPAVSIASGAGTTICSGTSVTFTATPTNGGTTPSYQWKLNGSIVGTNSTTYTTSALANGNQVSCVMTSNAACVSPATATSNTITMTVNAAVTPALSIASGAGTTICSGTSVTFTATPTNGGTTPSYQWKLNGSNVGTNTATYTNAALANNDQVSCVMTSNASCASPTTATSNTLTMTVTGSITPAVSIASGSGTTICSGTSVTFTATPTNGGSTPSYQWKLNGTNVGTNSATYTTSSLATGDQISCVMTSSAGCASTPTATSNTITMTVNSSVTPAVNIASGSGTTICNGTSVTFTATPTNGGTPSYQWKLNGSNVGTNSAAYTTSSLANNDQVSCVMTSNATCASPSTATSNTVTMTVNASVTPSVSIASGAGTTICSGTSVTFTATPTNGGAAPSYQWKLNGANVGTNSTTYTTSSLANNDEVSCVLTSNATCVSPTSATSNTLTMTVSGTVAPSVSIASNVGNTFCSGTTAIFTATPSNGGTTPAYQWKLNGGNVGSNSASYTNSTLVNGDVISCVMTSSSTCASPSTATSNSITIVITTSVSPAVSIAAVPGNVICGGTSVTFTATPTNGGSTPVYQWKLNGANVGSNSNAYTNATLANNDQVSCVLTSNASCLTSPTATSNAITMSVTASVTPSVSISANPGNTVCSGTSVTFTAIAVNGGSTPAYQWTLNGSNVGLNSDTYTNSSLANNDVVACILTSNANCASSASATSNTITMIVSGNVAPAVSIAASPGNQVCAGTNVTFIATPTNGGSSPSYQWTLNGSNVGTNSNTYSNNGLVTGDQIQCTMISNSTCASTSTAVSQVITMIVNSAGTPTIVTSGPTSFCQGGNVVLTSSAGDSYLWSPGGQTTQGITVTTSGTFSVTVTIGSCSGTSAGVTVTVNPLPSVTLSAFNAVCSTDPAFALSGGSPAGGTYSGNGVTNGNFDPAVAGVGSTTITYTYTNSNGCVASATNTIQVNTCGGGGCTTAPARPGYISGPSYISCGQSGVVYSIAPVTGATFYNWTVPAYVSITANTGTSITVNFLAGFIGGDIRVTAGNDCGTSSYRSKHLDLAYMYTGSIHGEEHVCPENLIQVYYINPVPGAVSYQWTVGGGAVLTANGNSATIDFTGVTDEHVLIRVRITNACGTVQTRSFWVEIKHECEHHDDRINLAAEVKGGLELYPNPANETYSIHFTTEAAATTIIRCTDILGNVMDIQEFVSSPGSNLVGLSTEKLAPGIYYVTVSIEGRGVQTVSLIVQK